jgi:nucleoside-diphosphate-sugar epimerase
MIGASPIEGLHGRHILVTGARGFIGGAIVQRLAATNCTLIRASRTPLPEPHNNVANVYDLVGNPSDPAFWQQAVTHHRADLIFHLAGQTSAYVAENDPEFDRKANVEPMRQLLDAVAASGRVIDILYAGTVTQAGLTEALPVDENTEDNPITVYDNHKLASEQMLEHAAESGIVRGTTLRLPNIFGPGTSVGSGDRGVLNKIIAKALMGAEISCFGDGHELRDYLFIDDVVEAFVLTSLAMEKASGQHFVLGTGKGYSLRETFELVAQHVGNATGTTVSIGRIPWPESALAIERRNFIADSSAIQRVAGWQAQIDLVEGIDCTIAALDHKEN